MLSLASIWKSKVSFLMRLWVTQNVDINTAQSGVLQSKGQIAQECYLSTPHCCPRSPFLNPESSLTARRGIWQTVPKWDGQPSKAQRVTLECRWERAAQQPMAGPCPAGMAYHAFSKYCASRSKVVLVWPTGWQGRACLCTLHIKWQGWPGHTPAVEAQPKNSLLPASPVCLISMNLALLLVSPGDWLLILLLISTALSAQH